MSAEFSPSLWKTPPRGRFFLLDVAPWAAAVCLLAGYFTTEHFLPWVSWHSEVPVFAGVVLLAAAGLASLCMDRRAVRIPWAAVPFLALGGVAVLQFAFGQLQFGGDLLVFSFYIGLAVACVAVGFNIGGQAQPFMRPHAEFARAARVIALIVLVASAVSVAIALAQALQVWESRWVGRMPSLRRPGGNMAQPNQLATLLGMGVAAVAFLYGSRSIPGRGAVALVLFLALGLAATESRTGMLIAAALVVWWQWKRAEIAPQVRWHTAPLLGLAFVTLCVAWGVVFEAAWPESAGEPSRLSGIGGSLRWVVWPQLLEASMLRPWAGWGVLQVPAAHNAVSHVGNLSEPYSYAHNIVLDLALWAGWPLALAMAGAVLVWLWRRARATDGIVPWYCIAALLPLGTHALLEYPHAYAYFLAPALVLVGILEASRGSAAVLRLPVLPAMGALLVTAVLLVASAAEYLAIEEDFRVARFEALRIGARPPEHEIPEVRLLTQLSALHAAFRVVPEENMSPQEIERLRSLAMRYPWGPTQYRYALALALNGDPTEAVRQLRVLRNQRGEALYRVLKQEIGELGQKHPSLRALALP